MAKETYMITTIDKWFDEKNIAKISSSKIVNAPEDADLFAVLEDLWVSIKHANDNSKTIKTSVLLLFAAITELWTLQKDKDTAQALKKKQMRKRMSRLRKMKTNKLIAIDSLMDSKNQLKEKAHEAERKLTHTELIKMNKMTVEIKDKETEILEYDSLIDSLKGSIGLYNYNLSKNMLPFADITTQLISKNQAIISMLKDFNVAPNKINEGRGYKDPKSAGGSPAQSISAQLEGIS